MHSETIAHLCAIRVEQMQLRLFVERGEGGADRVLNSAVSLGTRQTSQLNRPIAPRAHV